MHPTLIDLPGFRVHAYTACLSAAFVVCTLLAVRQAGRVRPPVDLSPNAGLSAFMGALLGAKAFYILQYHHPALLWRAFFVWEGGLVYYGGFIGAVLALYIHFSITRTPKWQAGDVAIIFVPLGQAITRMGCFLNGCCWGDVASSWVPWAVRFPKSSLSYGAYWQHKTEGLIAPDAMCSLPVHPTQLYMLAGLIAIFVLLKWSLSRKRYHGIILLEYALLYGVLRFTVEAFRADSTASVFGLTVSQTISVALVVGAILSFVALGQWPLRLGGEGDPARTLRDDGQ